MQRAIQFEAGGLTDVNLTSRWLIPHVTSELKGHDDGLFINQDIWAEAGDAQSSITPYAFSDDGRALYYYVDSNSVGTESLGECLREALSFVTAMFVISSCNLRLSLASRKIHDWELDELARSVTEMIVQVYDRESFLVWRRYPG